uniref:RecQ-mediated genome instability protein 1 n=1 Tax=Heterorhabditis bacteriophora TaxID=37862 RepID=A0A1I7XMC6_HETBA
MDEFVFNFFIERHIALKETWLSCVVMFIHEKFPHITNLTQLANMVFEQWKYSDLADSSYAVFEQLSINPDVVKNLLNRPFVVQIVSLIDIGSPFHSQLTKLTYELVDNSGFEALPENEQNNRWEAVS